MNIISIITGFASGILGAMGIGGGGVLVLYLSGFKNYPQLLSQGINLLFFLPIGLIAVLMHLKNHLIDKKTAIYVSLGALPSAAVGVYISSLISEELLRKGFGFFLLYLGVREIIKSFKTKSAHR